MRDLAAVEERLRSTYQAVATTTVLTAGPQPEPPPPRRHRLVTALAVLAVLVAGALALRPDDRDTTRVITEPTTPTTVAAAVAEVTCGRELPRPVEVPPGYTGPIAAVDGQLVLRWTSATGSIVVRWPADPEFRDLGGTSTTPDGQPSVSGSGTMPQVRRDTRTIVFFLRNVARECHSIQVDVVDTDQARVDDGIAWLSNRGLFVSNVPLVAGSEERAVAPTVIPCNLPAGVAGPTKRGGAVNSEEVYPTPAEALQAFLDASPSLIRNQYLEVRLPDASIAYAREQPGNPSAYVTVIHVSAAGGGWKVDRFDASGC